MTSAPVRAGLGILLVLVGAAYAILKFGALLLGDCSADCRARGEDRDAFLLGAAGLAVAVAGAVVAWRTLRARRAA